MADVYGIPRFQQGKSDLRRWISSPSSLLSYRYQALLLVFWICCFLTVFFWQKSSLNGLWIFRQASLPGPRRPMPNLRHKVFNLTDFGAVGDGKKVNTVGFEKAVEKIARHGGGQLSVPPGIWLTAPFNLTSHMTLFLAQGSVILGIEDEKYWTLMPPLPSYGIGREHPGPRYGSLIHGQKLKDVEITGHNGTIDGQAMIWWQKHRKKLLNHTGGPLIQKMWSTDIRISNAILHFGIFILLTARMYIYLGSQF